MPLVDQQHTGVMAVIIKLPHSQVDGTAPDQMRLFNDCSIPEEELQLLPIRLPVEDSLDAVLQHFVSGAL